MKSPAKWIGTAAATIAVCASAVTHATVFTINETLDLTTVTTSGAFLMSPLFSFPGVTPQDGDEIDYDVTFGNGTLGLAAGTNYALDYFIRASSPTPYEEPLFSSSVLLTGVTGTAGTNPYSTTFESLPDFFGDGLFTPVTDITFSGFQAAVDVLGINGEDELDLASFDIYGPNGTPPPTISITGGGSGGTTSVPEPGTASLLACGLAGLLGLGLRRRHRA
jgi:hypothetical protein